MTAVIFPTEARLKLLLAEDETVTRRLVARQLSDRFQVFEAKDGLEAVALFEQHAPDLVLLDVQMPNLDGKQAAHRISELAGDRYVPILLMSAFDELEHVINALASGADDFLPKPFNARLFESKLGVFLRVREMQQRLLDQNRALQAFQQETVEEQTMARRVFEKLLERGQLDDPRLRMVLSPLSVFNGDVVMAANTPGGGFRWMLGDIAGHGLAGALGTIPLVGAFHRMADIGVPREATLHMNAELRDTMPTGVFCAAAVLELDPTRTRLTVMNAGIPGIYVRRATSAEVVTVPSLNLPLGIVANRDYEVRTTEVAVGPGDRIFTMSDGIAECAAPDGALFGNQHVATLLGQGSARGAFDALITAVYEFTGGHQSDDVSLVEVEA